MNAIGVREFNINTVRNIIETYADKNLEQVINISDFCYYLTSGGILIFLEQHTLNGEEISKYISCENQCSSIFLHINNEETWTYVAHNNGLEVDRFNQCHNFCDDEKYKLSGNASIIERYFDINKKLVENYFKFSNDEINIKREKAYESDISEYGDYMQVLDFMYKLGFEYIEEIDSLEMKFKWLGKVVFYDNFTCVWNSSNKGGMRTAYRTRLEELINCCLENKTFEHDMISSGWLYIYFKDEYVEFSRNHQVITLGYKEFYDVIQKYVDIYLNKYWTSNIEKTKLITALEKINDISNKRNHTQPLIDENYNIIFKATLQENIINNATLDEIMKELEGLNCYDSSFLHLEPSIRIDDSLFLMVTIRETGGIKYYDVETEIEIGKTIKSYKLETMEIEYVKKIVYYYVNNNFLLTSLDWKDESHKVCINEIRFTLITDKEHTNFEIEDILKAIDEITVENKKNSRVKG